MSSQWGPPEIDCDAPPYRIVAACRQVGLESPEDVRWSRLGRHRLAGQGAREALATSWKWLFGGGAAADACHCGAPLPLIEEYTFRLISGKELRYHMGQCRRCRAIFWDELPSRGERPA